MLQTASRRATLCVLLAGCTATTKTGGLDPTPVLSTVEVSPASATIQIGDSIAFSAIGHMSDGSTSGVAILWSTTGGTISPAGSYHTGASAGEFLVVGATSDGSRADTAHVTVSATPVPVTLTSIVVTPALDTLAPGESQSFSVVGHYSNGTTGAAAVTWSATGGSISQSGQYQAGTTAGTFRVIALANAAPVADTSRIVIRSSPAVTLTSVTVAPTSVTLDPGATSQFSATGHYSDGSSGSIGATWSATGGTISSNGLYQAGANGGTYRVIGRVSGGTLADTSQVAIRDTTTPPAGGTTLLTEGFESSAVSGRGWYDNTNPVVSTAEHHSGSGSLEMTWQSGGTVPVQGGSMRHKFTATDRVYVRYWVKYSTNFVGSGQNYHPHEFQMVTDQDADFVGPSTTNLTVYVEENYQNGGRPQLSMTDVSNIDVTKLNVDLTNVTEQRASAGCNGSADGYVGDCYQLGSEWRNEKIWRATQPSFLPNPGPGYKGDWNLVEVYYQLNSIANGKGQKDGVAQYWFNGQLIIDHHDIVFRTAIHPTMKFNQFIIAPYIGDGSPVAQSMWVDDLVIATAKP